MRRRDVETSGVLMWYPFLYFLLVSEGSSLDIVREVAFISADGGNTWTAEG